MSPPGAAKEISTSVPSMADEMPETKTKRKLRFRR
jgi:hypothetical protein